MFFLSSLFFGFTCTISNVLAYHENNTKIFQFEVHTTKKNQRHTYPYIATQFEANSIGFHIVLHSSFIQFSLPFYLFQYAELGVYGKKLEHGKFEMQHKNKKIHIWRQTERKGEIALWVLHSWKRKKKKLTTRACNEWTITRCRQKTIAASNAKSYW